MKHTKHQILIFVGVTNGDVIFGVDVLLINRDTNQQEIITEYYIHD